MFEFYYEISYFNKLDNLKKFSNIIIYISNGIKDYFDTIYQKKRIP